MSSDDDDDSSASSSNESEDINLTGLVATRARRGNAGNLYETLRAHLHDEELQKELLVEDEAEDAEDYEGSDADEEDDGDALDSSSEDEDDQGPAIEGAAEDLTGEKELLKAERAENTKKRKAKTAKLTVPAWQRSVKKMKLVSDGHDNGGTSVVERQRKPKRIERGDWRSAGEDKPLRQSTRPSAVVNREVTHANLEESAKRALKQKATLQETLKRERTTKRVDLTLEQRLEKCRRIEKETARELGRFEREEAERERLRSEALLAKWRRNIQGPIIKTLVTSGYYENGKLKVGRIHRKDQDLDTLFREQREAEATKAVHLARQHNDETSLIEETTTHDHATGNQPAQDGERAEQAVVTEAIQDAAPQSSVQVTVAMDQPSSGCASMDVMLDLPSATLDTGVGSHADLTQPEKAAITVPQQDIPRAISPTANGAITIKTELDGTDTLRRYSHDDVTASISLPATTAPSIETLAKLDANHQDQDTASLTEIMLRPSWPPGGQAILFKQEPPSEPVPIVPEQARRSLVILESFPSLEGLSTKRSKTASGIEPSPVAQVLLPDSYPSFNDEQAIYLKKARKQKQDFSTKPTCALTSWPGKYIDPKTGVVFADVASYKMLQRMIAGGCAWNAMLECWTGPAYGNIGRPARGVPEGFSRPVSDAISRGKSEDS